MAKPTHLINKLLFCLFFITLFSAIQSCTDKKSDETPEEQAHCEDEPLIELSTESIEGYLEHNSYFPGDTINLYISSVDPIIELKFVEQNVKPKVILIDTLRNGQVQKYNQYSYRDGCDWEVSHKLVLSDTIQGGYKSILLTNSAGNFRIPVLVKSKSKSEILCVASTNTWQAYNLWGGASFYKYHIEESCPNKRPYADLVSFHRPFGVGSRRCTGHLFNAELGLTHWLEEKNLAFDVVADMDIHNNPELMKNYKMVFLNTHSEYWTKEAFDGLEEYLNQGGNLCYLGGNGIYLKVTINDKNQIECQKTNADHKMDGSPGGHWRNEKLNRNEASVLGNAYTAIGYNTYTPYMVINGDHWLFEGTELKKGDLFGESLNKKYASGHETDKINEHSPKNVVLLARGLNQEAIHELGKPDAARNGGADMVYYDHPGGGAVFSSGSITSSCSMLVDPAMSKIIENLVEKMVKQ